MESEPKPYVYPNVVRRRLWVPGINAEQEFSFVVVDRPEAWTEASNVKSVKTMQLGDRKLQIPCTGICWDDYVRIIHETHIPEWSTLNGKEPDDGFVAVQQAARLDRRVALIEKAIGKKLPGDTKEAKREWLRSRTHGEIESLMNFINQDVCCWSDFVTSTEMIERYRMACNSSSPIVSLSDSLEEWAVAESSKYTFWIQRPSEEFITEFHLCGMSRDKALEIQKETSPGEPPQMPQRNSTGQPIGMMPNPNDPAYQLKVSKSNKRELLLYLQHCLPFQVPGSTEEERSAWIGKRLIGDLSLLKEFIERNILSAQGTIASF